MCRNIPEPYPGGQHAACMQHDLTVCIMQHVRLHKSEGRPLSCLLALDAYRLCLLCCRAALCCLSVLRTLTHYLEPSCGLCETEHGAPDSGAKGMAAVASECSVRARSAQARCKAYAKEKEPLYKEIGTDILNARICHNLHNVPPPPPPSSPPPPGRPR
eukprot:scaffold14790_cov138-Isochrysis_galbana.AAC.1